VGRLSDLVSLLLGPTENEDDTVEYPTTETYAHLSVNQWSVINIY